jgi:hypothetical protein
MKKKSAFRQVFIEGKSSSRPQHLAFNQAWHKILWMVCPATAGSVFISSLYNGGDLICLWELLIVPPLFRFNEIWNTPDNDLAWKVNGFRGFYWKLYSHLLPDHRSIFSHSLLLGTPLRFCIAYWFPILAFVILWNWQVFWDYDSIRLENLTFPSFAEIFILYWYAAAILADICHLTLDKYNPIEWLFGQR